MTSNQKIYLINVMLLLNMFVSRFIPIKYLNIYLAISFILIGIIAYKTFGYRNQNKQIKKILTQVSLLILLLYFVLTSLSGLIFGYTRNPLDTGIISIISNTYSIVVVTYVSEIIRYMVAPKSIKKNLPLIVTTISICIIDILMVTNNITEFDTYYFFIILTTQIVPLIIRNILCTYFAKHSVFVPGLLFRLFFLMYPYFMPIFPNISNYIDSHLGVVVPYVMYLMTLKYLNDYERTRQTRHLKGAFWYTNIPFWTLIIALAILISGFFKYQIMAVGSGSMEKVISYGDAVIFEKINSDNFYNLKEGNVIVFRHDNDYIVHRIISIKYNNNDVIIQTKGDANNTQDDFILRKDDLVGIVRTNIKYIGLPTVWLRNKLK